MNADPDKKRRKNAALRPPFSESSVSPVMLSEEHPMKKTVLLLLATAALAAAPAYKVVNKIKIGGGTRWDYAFLDSANHRLYVSHGTQTKVIDTATDKLVGTIPDTK